MSKDGHRFSSARLNNPVVSCRSAGVACAEPPIGRGARDGERGADCGESVECAGERRAQDAQGQGGDAAEPAAASARGARQHRASNRPGPIPRESRHWENRADLSNEISERDAGGKPILCRWKANSMPPRVLCDPRAPPAASALRRYLLQNRSKAKSRRSISGGLPSITAATALAEPKESVQPS